MSPIIKKTLTNFLLFFAPLLISETKDISIVVHGGAGWFSSMTEDEIEGIESALNNAADLGYGIMLEGGSSLDAVEKAIIVLENNPLFNAGKGSVYTSELKQEMDASIMDGSNLDAGAVASITSVKNPITLARYVMENTEHVMFSSTGAEKIAKEAGLETVSASYFYSEEKLERAKKQIKADAKMGTVGVVALDAFGNIAAGTSTGGMTNKKPGRIGDSPIIGAGTWAENGVCGVSGTGHGEYFIRLNVAKEICVLMKYQNLKVQKAAQIVIDRLAAMGADGGVIVLDNKGDPAMVFNTPAMARAYKNTPDDTFVRIYKD
ncbi:isoaspartyl peptidase/L-asparaginase [Gammaproteobacteria bacterium]|nr:isoaspartyl peptidase/L-asparaginase [Gammaproteobacteria bacterium]